MDHPVAHNTRSRGGVMYANRGGYQGEACVQEIMIPYHKGPSCSIVAPLILLSSVMPEIVVSKCLPTWTDDVKRILAQHQLQSHEIRVSGNNNNDYSSQ